MKKKLLASVVAIALVACCVIGGTLAWLTDKTDPVVNTFTVGDVNIDLAENTGTNYKIVPGVDIDKDPTVTVEAGSEACYLFIKVDESNWPDFKEADGTTRKVNYAIASGWTALEGQTNVYYRVIDAETANTGVSYTVLADNTITVSDNLTKTELDTVTTVPTLTFTAYAVQSAGINSATDAWTEVNG